MILTTQPTITTAQIIRIHALLNQTGNMDNKEEIVSGFTDHRTTHSSQMTQQEAFKMIDHLAKYTPLQNVLNDAKNKMRRKIISMAYEMRWAKPGDWQAAVKAIDTFCKGTHGKFKKALNKHTHAELVQLVTQFEQLYKKHLSSF